MGMEQERKGGGGEWLWRRPGLRRLRVEELGGSPGHRPGRTSTWPLQGDGDVVSMETGVCICRRASRLGLSDWFSPCVCQLEETRHRGQRMTETERGKGQRSKVTQGNFSTSPRGEVIVSLSRISNSHA